MGRKRKIPDGKEKYVKNEESREEVLQKLQFAMRREMKAKAALSPAETESKTDGESASENPFEAGDTENEGDTEAVADLLWRVLLQYQKEPFYTVKGLEFTYYIRGNELFVNRKDKSITRASVEVALRKAMDLNLIVSGPKKLTSFGASYLYPIFLKIGIIRVKP